MDQTQLMAQAIGASLADLGLAFDPAKRYRPKRIYDTQDIPTAAGTVVEFFNTSTSSKSANALGLPGCNLREVGQVDDHTTFLPVGFALDVVGMQGAGAADAQDVSLLNDYGIMRAFWVDDRPHLDDPVFFREMYPGGVAVPVKLEDDGAAALAFDTIEGKGGGYILPAFARPFITGGQSIKAELVYGKTGGTALGTAVPVRLSCFGVEITRKA